MGEAGEGEAGEAGEGDAGEFASGIADALANVPVVPVESVVPAESIESVECIGRIESRASGGVVARPVARGVFGTFER
ncbi:hypothetical protein ACWD4G_36535 [Streptomyces sp. NPDC002643]